MIDDETNDNIRYTKQKLENVNRMINEYLETLTEKHVSLYESDRRLLMRIRDKNLETIQLIDKLNYTGVVEL